MNQLDLYNIKRHHKNCDVCDKRLGETSKYGITLDGLPYIVCYTCFKAPVEINNRILQAKRDLAKGRL